MKLLLGDCRDYLFSCKEGVIDLVVTSPPYDNLRSYNDSSSWDWGVFVGVVAGLWRVIKEGGVVVWVVADQTINGSETGTSFKQALFFKEIGFKLHDTMIYQRTGAPITTKRYESGFEYIFVFVKGELKTFNGIMVSRKYIDKRVDKKISQSKDGRHTKRFKKQTPTVLRDNVFKYPVGGGLSTKDKEAHQHPAIFPEKLASDNIKTWSNKGDTVLDPFMGSGTTGKVACLLNRDFVGIEIDETYFKLAKNRIEKTEKCKLF